MRILPPLAAAALLAGCATSPTPRAPDIASPPPVPGMELLLGQPFERASELLGLASLDRREGPARHVQFAGACILDLFYYPRSGQPPVATHAEARLTDGRPLSAGDCLQLLLGARGAR